MNNTYNNVGKCGHAKCAGGDGSHCYERGKPMRTLEHVREEYTEEQKRAMYAILDRNTCPQCGSPGVFTSVCMPCARKKHRAAMRGE